MKKGVLDGKHRLTNHVIDKLTSYYGASIRRNKGKTVADLRIDIINYLLPLYQHR